MHCFGARVSFAFIQKWCIASTLTAQVLFPLVHCENMVDPRTATMVNDVACISATYVNFAVRFDFAVNTIHFLIRHVHQPLLGGAGQSWSFACQCLVICVCMDTALLSCRRRFDILARRRLARFLVVQSAHRGAAWVFQCQTKWRDTQLSPALNRTRLLLRNRLFIPWNPSSGT